MSTHIHLHIDSLAIDAALLGNGSREALGAVVEAELARLLMLNARVGDWQAGVLPVLRAETIRVSPIGGADHLEGLGTQIASSVAASVTQGLSGEVGGDASGGPAR